MSTMKLTHTLSTHVLWRAKMVCPELICQLLGLHGLTSVQIQAGKHFELSNHDLLTCLIVETRITQLLSLNKC